MKKNEAKRTTKKDFVSLSAIIARRSKSERFRSAFSEEDARLKLASELKVLRREKRMTQEEVAAKAEMPQSVIARIESGTHNFSLTTLHRIAEVFDKEIGFVEHTQNRR
ncbi:MAG: helix-turn-helix transcriptional regulator [Candidatus Liptonbacteria bacterium]|nr:helix-turn-helix transcriptional regulator [Candidatus Liptonbacteria bacterium]